MTTTNVPTVTPLALLQQAIDKGINPNELSQLMDLQERYEKRLAAEAYAAAIAEFQRRCPAIRKGRKPQSGPSYTYASYDDIMAVAGPLLAELGIVVAFSTEQVDKSIRVTCRLTVGTHSESHTFTVPIPDMRVNDTQKFGAALSYAKRYGLQGSLNIVVTDEDTDAANLADKSITEDQALQIEDWIVTTNADRARFLKWAKVDRIADLPASKYQNAIDLLSKKQGAAK